MVIRQIKNPVKYHYVSLFEANYKYSSSYCPTKYFMVSEKNHETMIAVDVKQRRVTLLCYLKDARNLFFQMVPLQVYQMLDVPTTRTTCFVKEPYSSLLYADSFLSV